MWNLTVLIPDHCISVYFILASISILMNGKHLPILSFQHSFLRSMSNISALTMFN